jgi:hypothetical protein
MVPLAVVNGGQPWPTSRSTATMRHCCEWSTWSTYSPLTVSLSLSIEVGWKRSTKVDQVDHQGGWQPANPTSSSHPQTRAVVL